MQAHYKKYILNFKRPSGTSRGVLTQKETWFLILHEDGNYGIGECGILRGLSIDDVSDYEERLKWTCENIHLGKEALWEALMEFPSIQFGVEQAFTSLESNNPFVLFPSEFTNKSRPIAINGLIWMGDESFMHEQIAHKLSEGFKCIKMKIGAIDFDTEIALLSSIRKKYDPSEIELRVDANGAFTAEDALHKLSVLGRFSLHSIEQPVKQGQFQLMRDLCAKTPLPIALDEELIGVFGVTKKEELLQTIQPQYIILKPSLVGGYRGCKEWIEIAERMHIGWWITSALESNVGLNAIAQWTYTLQSPMPQGLGTGSLYTNNLDSPLTVQKGQLFYRDNKKWKSNLIEDLCI
ncbi:o-succinylbenzoate synthase [Zobellia galactanivorans]|uniref:o-succinylbenzoate synthase n=1 Tax=Zobellia galactanivorans (strain DSM 12802 / CCUG 47099 / CIP 106680 / NCIMB 13871 / Dsij) TaxID=63186 RepID=G0L7N4_ZOBGA|nr:MULTISPECIES: o-succinylbenzoate synthase [Zobellia]MBU3024649.1 o-succinylbenzoate synthase [Zobellia galactanivorans]MDO6807742.1 o-succinylbenzoate synthase [Zobellia galactanivorans]OWW25550.1 o-succinylbenzoate synthase [Zobellia sp. OII3]CAZ98165.1 O-succinylbenzoate synthase [Zobellia galactanivorans]